MGGNAHGQLGDGSKNPKAFFSKVMSDGTAVTAGYYHTVVLKRDGTVWTAGLNDAGQLGDSTGESRTSFVPATSGAQSVAAGAYHTLVIKDGKLYGCGNIGAKFVSGTGSTSNKFVLMESDVRAAAGGLGFTLVVKRSGSVWATGQNQYGQLGVNSKAYKDGFVEVPSIVGGEAQAVAAGASHSLVLLRNGHVMGSGRTKFFGPLVDPAPDTVDIFFPVILTGASAVVAGSSQSMIITRSGGLNVTGNNTYGQLGLDAEFKFEYARVMSDGVRVAAAGESHALVQKNDGSVWVTGMTHKGQLTNANFDAHNGFSRVEVIANNSYYRKISTGSCAGSDMLPIHSKAECERAATEIGLSDKAAILASTNALRPEGCYYADNSATGVKSLFVETHASNKGKGAVNSGTVSRHPLCKGYYKIISDGNCESKGMLPVTTKTECELAAKKMDLFIKTATTTDGTTPSPEGCFVYRDAELVVATNVVHKGKGAETGAGIDTRLPICKTKQGVSGLSHFYTGSVALTKLCNI